MEVWVVSTMAIIKNVTINILIHVYFMSYIHPIIEDIKTKCSWHVSQEQSCWIIGYTHVYL